MIKFLHHAYHYIFWFGLRNFSLLFIPCPKEFNLSFGDYTAKFCVTIFLIPRPCDQIAQKNLSCPYITRFRITMHCRVILISTLHHIKQQATIDVLFVMVQKLCRLYSQSVTLVSRISVLPE